MDINSNTKMKDNSLNSIDIINPELMTINGKVFRKNPFHNRSLLSTPTNDNYSNKEDAVNTELLVPVKSETIMTPIFHDGKFKLEIDQIEPFYYRVLIRKYKDYVDQLANRYSCEIFIPTKLPSSEKITIFNAKSSEICISIANELTYFTKNIDLGVKINYFIYCVTKTDLIQTNFKHFKKTVLQKDSNYSNYIIKFESLHLTIAVLQLETESDKKEFFQVFDKICEDNVNLLNRKNPIVVDISGIDYMGNDPENTKVVYAKVVEVPDKDSEYGSLQILFDGIYNNLKKEGYISPRIKQYTVKLHMTLLKSHTNVFQTAPNYTHEYFNCTPFLNEFKDFYFGRVTINNIYLAPLFKNKGNFQPIRTFKILFNSS